MAEVVVPMLWRITSQGSISSVYRQMEELDQSQQPTTQPALSLSQTRSEGLRILVIQTAMLF